MHNVGFEKHDHSVCVSDTLRIAEEYCDAHKVQLTKGRRRVLEILLEEHKAMGAYDILAQLTQEGGRSQPPVVYRALDFLVAHGFVHKVERLNAYVACAHPGADHTPALMVCRKCSAVLEASARSAQQGLDKAALEAGFQIEAQIVEVEGLCPNCRGTVE